MKGPNGYEACPFYYIHEPKKNWPPHSWTIWANTSSFLVTHPQTRNHVQKFAYRYIAANGHKCIYQDISWWRAWEKTAGNGRQWTLRKLWRMRTSVTEITIPDWVEVLVHQKRIRTKWSTNSKAGWPTLKQHWVEILRNVKLDHVHYEPRIIPATEKLRPDITFPLEMKFVMKIGFSEKHKTSKANSAPVFFRKKCRRLGMSWRNFLVQTGKRSRFVRTGVKRWLHRFTRKVTDVLGKTEGLVW